MPLTQSWLDFEQAAGGRVVLHGTPEELKAQYEATVQMLLPFMPPLSENVEVNEGQIEAVKYRTYKPKGEAGPLPTGVWFHGGGLMTGNLDSDEFLCRVVAEHTKTAIVNVDYRLIPDFEWPAQLEDGMKVYRWAHANAASFGGDSTRFFTIGGSAGGMLALAVANQVVSDPELKQSLKGIAAIVPATAHWDSIPDKYKDSYKAYKDNEKDVPIIDKESMDTFYKHADVRPDDKSYFTLLASENHAKLPPVYFASCEYDPLRDDAKVMEMALQEQGVKTKHDFYPGLPHYFWIFPQVPDGQQFVANLLGGVEWLKSQM